MFQSVIIWNGEFNKKNEEDSPQRLPIRQLAATGQGGGRREILKVQDLCCSISARAGSLEGELNV